MFNGKKRKQFLTDLELINRKLSDLTPVHMRTNGVTIFNKKVSVLFKYQGENGMVENSIQLGDVTSAAIKYHELGTDEFVQWLIASAMELGSQNN